MKRIVRLGVALPLAAGLFVAGAIGSFRLSSGGDDAGAAGGSQASALLGPVVSGSLDQLTASLQQRLRSYPNDWRSAATLGLAYVQQARRTTDPSYYPKAQAILERSLGTNRSENFQAMVGMAALASGRHDFSGALQWGKRAQKVNPYNANVYGVIGDARAELGRYRAAFDSYQKMVNTTPGVSSYARVAQARELMGDVPGAIGAMEAALELASEPADKAWASYQLGELYFNSGSWARARSQYRRGTELDPSYVPSFAGLAKVAWATGDVRRAIRGYADVVARYPYPEYVIALGDLYRATGDRARARQQYGVLRAEERLFLSAGVNLDLEFALFRADHGDPSGALVAARQAWDQRQSVQVADAYAWALYRNGRFKEAWVYERKALALGYRSALFNFHAGMIRLGLGDPGAARRYLSISRSINPKFSVLMAPVAKRTLQRLGGTP